MAKIGDIQVCDYAAEYDATGSGFVIEQFGHHGTTEPFWALPAWDERGLDSLSGHFASREEAEAALRKFAEEHSICIDCDGVGLYPSDIACGSCAGTGFVASDDGDPITAIAA